MLSIGVNDYSQLEGFENVTSASFDAIQVATKYENLGFRVTHLKNPTANQIVLELGKIKQLINDV